MGKCTKEVGKLNDDLDFDNLAEYLKKKINDDQKKIYSQKVIAEFNHPIHLKKMSNPDATATVKGPCGDTMRIDLSISNNTIIEACFWTDGCGASIACGNMLMKLIKRKTLMEAKNITAPQLLNALDGLPEEHQHCALLSVNTLNNSISTYLTN